MRTGDVLEEYAGEKLGFYQLLGSDGMFEIRVQTGRVGFKREFEKGDDPLLAKILDFCRKQRYIQVSRRLRDEEFFKQEPKKAVTDAESSQPWKGRCSFGCYHARGSRKKCRCRCDGKLHGRAHKEHNEKLRIIELEEQNQS